jgi:urease accessory protein
MILIESIPDPPDPQSLLGKQADRFVATWEERRWLRGKYKTASGRDFALALPTGTVLAPGAILFVADNWYLQVEGAPEPVLAVTPSGYHDAVRLAFEVGNRHFPLAISGQRLLVPDDTAMVQLLDRLGVPWQRCREIFSPIGKAHSHDHPHQHSHPHEHTHEHSHDHAHQHEQAHAPAHESPQASPHK